MYPIATIYLSATPSPTPGRSCLRRLKRCFHADIPGQAAVVAFEVAGVAVGGAIGGGDLGPQVTRFLPARLLSYSALSAPRSIASASSSEGSTPSIVATPKLAVTTSLVSGISTAFSAHSRRIRSATE